MLANNLKPVFDHVETMQPATAKLEDLDNVYLKNARLKVITSRRKLRTEITLDEED